MIYISYHWVRENGIILIRNNNCNVIRLNKKN